MVAWSAVTRHHVLAAIKEYDEVGQDAFLELYGFAPSPEFVLRHADHSYDSKAILGVALRYSTGEPATAADFTGAKDSAARVLRDLDFTVLSPEKAAAAASAPTTTIPNQRRTNGIEPVVAICPTCFLALSAFGTCDNCD